MALTEDDDFVADRNAAVDRDWVARIETTLQWCQREWGFDVGVERRSGLNGYVVDAHMTDGSMSVLKVRRPDGKMRREADALTCVDGGGTVRLLQRSDDHGAMLLERLEPGDQLGECLDSVDADQVICDLVATWSGVVAPESAVPLSEQAERWANSLEQFGRLDLDAPLPAAAFADAARELRRLAVSQGEQQYVHGDLHLGNVVSGTRRSWLAIDPKNLVGESLFDLAWWLRDPPTGVDDATGMEPLLRRRLDAVADSAAEADRCLAWARACAVVLVAARTCAMSAWDARRHAACATALQQL